MRRVKVPEAAWLDRGLSGETLRRTRKPNPAITRSRRVTGGGSAPSSLGGIFTQATNIGQYSRNQFAVAPQVELEGGYRLENGVRLFVGYDFLYINNVVRPGNQIDTTLNLTGNATLTPPGTLAGAARPGPMMNGSSFWAQGAKIGASYAF